MFVALQRKNPGLRLFEVSVPEFARYGRVLHGLEAAQAMAFARQNSLPGGRVVYEPSLAGLEADQAFVQAVSRQVYAAMPVQVGRCCGRNLQLNALEYHKGTEVLVAVTDLVLLLGRVDDIQWGSQVTYDTSGIEAFVVPQHTMVELYPWSLHFAPCHVHERTGFCALIVLPQGTNGPLGFVPDKGGESALCFGRNKWLIAHPEATALVQQGAYVGLTGDNLVVQAL